MSVKQEVVSVTFDTTSLYYICKAYSMPIGIMILQPLLHPVSVSRLLDDAAAVGFGIAGTQDGCREAVGILLEGAVGVLWTDGHVDVLDHEEVEELLPAFHHAVGLLLGVVGEDLGVFVGVGLLGSHGYVFYHLFLLDGRDLKGVAHLLEVGEYFAVVGIDVVADGVLQPEGALHAVVEVVLLAGNAAVADGHFVAAAIDWGEGGHVGVVVGEPDDAADGVGQVAAHLAYDAEAGLLGGDGSLVEVFLSVEFPGERCWQVGHLVGSSTGLVAEVEGCVFVVVAHGGNDFFEGDGLVGLDVERHFGVAGCGVGDGHKAKGVVGVGGHAAVETVEEAPDTGFAVAGGTEIAGGKGIAEGEVCIILACEVAFCAGKLDDVLGVEHVLLVFQVKTCDAALVGVGANAVVGNADCYPIGSLYTRAFAYHLHDPNFVFVADGEGFTLGVVAVLCYEVGHNLDGFAGCGGSLQCQLHEGGVVDDAGGVAEFLASAECGFADSDLVFVHLPNDAVGRVCLWDFAPVTVGVAVVDFAHFAFGVFAAPVEVHAAEGAVVVGGVGDKDGLAA